MQLHLVYLTVVSQFCMLVLYQQMLFILCQDCLSYLASVITASHNPKEYNGLKLCNSGAVPIGEHSGLLEIKNNIKNIDVGEINNLHLETNNELDLYFQHIQKIVEPEKVNSYIKFGVDGGNGAIGSIFEQLSTIYKFDCEKLYMEVDGNFPNHPADPSNKDNLKEIIKLVKEKKIRFWSSF
jgi:phosphomannomutase